MKSISFSAAMIKAILRGSKTQTRRVFNPQPHPSFLARGVVSVVPQWPDQDGIRWFMADGMSELVKCLYGKPGDILTVKEAAWMWCEQQPNGKTAKGRQKFRYEPMIWAPVFYVSDHPKKPNVDVVSPSSLHPFVWKYKIPRFVPSWALRTEIEITGIRVERLNEISEHDARAEGIIREKAGLYIAPGTVQSFNKNNPQWAHTARGAFDMLWDSINGEKHPWSGNPFVWVIEFRRAK